MAAIRRFNIPDAAPAPKTARYAHAVEVGELLHVTGQLPVDPADPHKPLPLLIESQAELVFANLRRIVHGSGYAFEDTVFVRVYLTDFDRDYSRFNEVYDRHFPNDEHLPARTTVGVARLGLGALIEIDLVVARRQN